MSLKIILRGDGLDLSKETIGAPGITFASRAEAVVACLYEELLPWKAIPGITVHVKVGRSEIDFWHPNLQVFDEYHPIGRREWRDNRAARHFGEVFKRLPMRDKRDVWGALKEEFATRYYTERRRVLNDNGLGGSGLVVNRSCGDVYRNVVRGMYNIPISQIDFQRKWGALMRQLD